MFRALRMFLSNSNRSTQLLEEIKEGVANQSRLINDRLRIVEDGQRAQVHELKNLQKQLSELLARQ